MPLEEFATYIILPMLMFSVPIVFVRIVRGPSLPDRVVAIDQMNILGIGIIATYAIATEQSAFLDVAITMALVSFLGTVAFAYYIERRM